MDIGTILAEFQQQRDRVDRAINSLKEILEENGGPLLGLSKSKKRGRTHMKIEERREVSARMKRYWQQRRGRQAELRETA